MIIIRGRNHYPQDIEDVAERAHPALRPGGCAAFAVEGTGQEELVVVAEVRKDADPDTDPEQVTDAVRAAVLREHDVVAGRIVLIGPGELPKTSSGKVRRTTIRAHVVEGRVQEWTAPARPEREAATEGTST